MRVKEQEIIGSEEEEEQKSTNEQVDEHEQFMNSVFSKPVSSTGRKPSGRCSLEIDPDFGDFDERVPTVTEDFLRHIPQSVQKKNKLIEEMRRPSLLKSRRATAEIVTLQDFEIQMMIGSGTFGKVYLAVLASSAKKYAIKVIRKDKLIDQGSIVSTELEKDILLAADHPFLCGMEYLF